MLLVHTALMSEAKGFVEGFGLNAVRHDSGVRLFHSEDMDMLLAVSGVGRYRAATTTGFAIAHCRERFGVSPFVLNVGVCGSADPDKRAGQVFFINQCRDASSGRSYYPDCLFRHQLPPAKLHTFDWVIESRRHLEETAPGAELVDMEAAGVFEATTMFLAPSRALSVKVVGDFLDDAFSVTREIVEQRIREASPEIAGFIADYRRFAEDAGEAEILSSDEERLLQTIDDTFRLTRSQRAQLNDAARFSRLSGAGPLNETVGPFLKQTTRHKHERTAVFRELLERLHEK